MLSLSTIFTLMMVPGICMLATSFIVSFFENEHKKVSDSHFVEADVL
ncbi:hypothetical protein AAD001_00255 [Colwelliaceae bacterium 6471]